jgi:hypothetical protein
MNPVRNYASKYCQYDRFHFNPHTYVYITSYRHISYKWLKVVTTDLFQNISHLQATPLFDVQAAGQS